VKDEYEPTSNYERRIAALNEKPLVGSTNYNGRFAFTFVPGGDQFEMKYDPDASALDVVIKWERPYKFGTEFASLRWSDSSRKIRSYVGRNAFNRSVRVSVYRNDYFYLLSELRNLNRIEGVRNNVIATSLPMPPSEARSAKTNLHLLIVGRLRNKTPLLYERSHDRPEITDPYERYNAYYGLNIVVEEIWLYDYPTGKVLLRLVENSESATPNTETLDLNANDPLLPYQTVPSGPTEELKIISKPRAGYTDSARQANVEGTVVLEVKFLPSCQVGSIAVVKGLPNGLTEQAIAAARRIRFDPAKINGVPQTVISQIEYTFSMYESAAPTTVSNGVLNGGDLNGKATFLPKPAYPPAAKAVRAGGAVSVQVLIDENGNVISANAVSGHPLLHAAAASAARGARFSPTLVGGKPVKVSGIVTYNFVP
jgi:TonB family protein